MNDDMDERAQRRMTSTTIYITLEQHARLKALSERTKVPRSVYIRTGIDLVLKRATDE